MLWKAGPVMIQLKALACILVAVVVGLTGCKRESYGSGPPEPIVSTEQELLDGLKAGDTVAGFTVVWIGGVRPDGTMDVALKDGSQRMRVTIALYSDTPIPIVRTEKYGLFGIGRGPDMGTMPSFQKQRVIFEAVAERIRKVEADVPTPTGMKQLQ